MYKLFSIFLFLLAVFRTAGGDNNVYGPGGKNLGPNAESPFVSSVSEKDRQLEKAQEKILLLQDQIKKLEQQVKLLQSHANPTTYNQVKIDFNSAAPRSSNNIGWIGGIPFLPAAPGPGQFKPTHDPLGSKPFFGSPQRSGPRPN